MACTTEILSMSCHHYSVAICSHLLLWRGPILIGCYINNYSNWGRISIRCWIHKTHPIPRPNRRAMECLFLYLRENGPRYNGTALLSDRGCSEKYTHTLTFFTNWSVQESHNPVKAQCKTLVIQVFFNTRFYSLDHYVKLIEAEWRISMRLVQERRDSSALAMELCLSCTNPSICVCKLDYHWFRK